MNIRQKLAKVSMVLLLSSLYACSSGDNNSDAASGVEQKADTVIPQSIQKLTLTGGGTLSAYITIDGDTANRKAMTLDTVAGTASVSIPGLSRASHTIQISYEYSLSGNTYIVATASKTVDLSSGSASLNIVGTDYDLDSYDNDNDGISNAAELRAGTNPGDASCVLDTSIIGSCTLG